MIPRLSLERIVAALMVLIGLLGLGTWGGHKLARNHYEPLLSEANKQIGILTDANSAMKTSVERQNTAVTELEAEFKKREQNALKALAAAQSQSAKYQAQAQAQAVLLSKLPAGHDACEAAQKSFDDALRKERAAL